MYKCIRLNISLKQKQNLALQGRRKEKEDNLSSISLKYFVKFITIISFIIITMVWVINYLLLGKFSPLTIPI
jgi:hypothetical protein